VIVAGTEGFRPAAWDKRLMSRPVCFVLSLVVVAGCAKSSGDRAPGGCTGLDAEACLLPWPSSAFLVADATRRTGFRVSIPAASMPMNDNGERLDPAAWNAWDGFSPMTTLIAEFTSVIDPAPFASWHDPGASLAVDSPTVIIDVDSGERIAHFAEIEDSPQVATGHTTLYVRPAARLQDNHHYAVGIRGLRTKDGAPVTPSAEFAVLRDGHESAIDADWYTRDVFAPLARAGVDRASLLLAWDFRTASGETAWGDVVAMRDDAFAMAGAAGLGCVVVSSVEDPSDPLILRRIDGTITVPNFLDGNRIARDAAGRPKIVGTTEAPFTALIPRSAGAKAPIWIYGHGLFSQRDELLRDNTRNIASRGGAVIAGTDFTGLTGADESTAIGAFLDPSTFPDIVDPLRQSSSTRCFCRARSPAPAPRCRRCKSAVWRSSTAPNSATSATAWAARSGRRWLRCRPTLLISDSAWRGWISRCRCRATTPGRTSREFSRPSGRAGSIATSSW
jgi:hypothetical protein